MPVDPLSATEIDPPRRRLLQTFLALDPPRPFTIEDLEDRGASSSNARKEASEATKSQLAVRIQRGRYVALDPSIAIRAWALPSYYARLLTLHGCLEHLDVDHAFVCLGASQETDLLFDRPWLVIGEEAAEQLSAIDRFVYAAEATDEVTLEIMGASFDLPVLGRFDTALLLAATGLPREREAAAELVDDRSISREEAANLNAFGLNVDPDVLESRTPELELPDFIEERRRQLGEELLREGSS